MVRAVADNTHEVQPVSAWVDGPYGIEGVYLGVPVALGRDGVEEVVELALSDEEVAALRAAADAVRARQAEVVALGL
jgi:malate dehydrogenase